MMKSGKRFLVLVVVSLMLILTGTIECSAASSGYSNVYFSIDVSKKTEKMEKKSTKTYSTWEKPTESTSKMNKYGKAVRSYTKTQKLVSYKKGSKTKTVTTAIVQVVIRASYRGVFTKNCDVSIALDALGQKTKSKFTVQAIIPDGEACPATGNVKLAEFSARNIWDYLFHSDEMDQELEELFGISTLQNIRETYHNSIAD